MQSAHGLDEAVPFWRAPVALTLPRTRRRVRASRVPGRSRLSGSPGHDCVRVCALEREAAHAGSPHARSSSVRCSSLRRAVIRSRHALSREHRRARMRRRCVSARRGLDVRVELAQVDEGRDGSLRQVCHRKQQPNRASPWFAVASAWLHALKRERGAPGRRPVRARRRRENLKRGADLYRIDQIVRSDRFSMHI